MDIPFPSIRILSFSPFCGDEMPYRSIWAAIKNRGKRYESHFLEDAKIWKW